jgi:hypothetical protein
MRFTTKDLRDLPMDLTNGTQGEFQLLHLRAGDAVQVAFDAFNDEQMRALKTEELRVQRLRELGYSQVVANLVATNYQHINQFKNPWYTKTASFDWDVQSGLQIEVEGVAFILPKRDDGT